MSKKIIITISVALSILLAVLVAYYFLGRTPSDTQGGVVSGFRSFFPFGGESNPSTTSTSTPTQNNNENAPEVTNNFLQKLRKLSAEPVSGAGISDTSAGSIVRYIEKATGHIYEVELFSPKQGRISNTTIPLVYDAIWGNKNTSLITRYLEQNDKTVSTYSLTVKNVSTTTENTITGISFGGFITDVSVFDANVFYLERSETFSTGYTSNFDGSKKKQIWNSPLKDLTSQYVNEKTVALTTKPYQGMPGYLYLVDTNNGSVKTVLRKIPGLSTLVDNDASQILYLKQEGSAILYTYNTKNQANLETGISTFPEKCVWSKKDKNILFCATPKEFIGQNSLTDWYRGLVSYSDEVKRYDIRDGSYSTVGDLTKESGEVIDVTKPILTENEQYLIFINKKDNSLWSLDLTK
ncbi:MAG: hypothetical protein ABL917_01765 [Parcubacteria group bacterium]